VPVGPVHLLDGLVPAFGEVATQAPQQVAVLRGAVLLLAPLDRLADRSRLRHLPELPTLRCFSFAGFSVLEWICSRTRYTSCATTLLTFTARASPLRRPHPAILTISSAKSSSATVSAFFT
jgi:hypothetical protein